MQLGRSVAVKAPSVGAALGVISETGAAPSLALYCCATGRVAVSERGLTVARCLRRSISPARSRSFARAISSPQLHKVFFECEPAHTSLSVSKLSSSRYDGSRQSAISGSSRF